jgi:hypothetical protein
MHRPSVILLGIALLIGSLSAQQTFLSGPVQGYIFDLPTQSFRAVIGLPGSASFGPASVTGFDTGWVAPHKNYAIGFQQGNCLLVTALDSAQATTAPIAGVSGLPDAITWSGDGTVAVLYSGRGSWLQVITGIPNTPQVDAPVDLSQIGGSISAVAADPQGQNIALAIQGANGGVFLTSDGQNFVPALSMANPAALTFSGEGASLYILDGNALQLTVLAVVDHSSQTFPLNGLQNPSAIAWGRDAQGHSMVYVAGATDQMLQIYDPVTQQDLMDLPLDFQPSCMGAFGPNSFVITSRSQPTDPLWLFASAPQPAVYFVPAAQAGAGGLN